MMASTPCSSSILASATVVALEMMKIPASLMGRFDDLPIRQAKIEAHHLRFGPHQHRQMFAADFTGRTCWLGYCSQALGIEVWLQTRPHRLADFRSNAGFRPERIVDVEAAAAHLLKAGDPPLCVFG